MMPIPGTSQIAHLEENCAASDVTLDETDVLALNALAH
jgi:aryl-alcohol dehydrogenase-like predicted oxidoreductase